MNARPLMIIFRSVVLLLVISVFILGGTVPAVAWDSVPDEYASHWQFLRDAVSDLYAESPARYGELQAQLHRLHDGSLNEDVHSQRRTTDVPFPSEFYQMAVGNNPGNTHPEYYWQTAIYHYRKYLDTHTPSELEAAYFYLGSLIHIIEDMSAPPHTYNAMHGGLFGTDNFEVLSFGNLDYDYYRHPDSLLQPGKNILDVGRHGDDDYLEATLRKCQNDWVEIFQTNLQAPAARTVKVYTYNPPGWPVFYLEFNYQTLVNGIYQEATHESGAMCAAYTCDEPRTHEWSDNFAPNTTLRVSYKRPECGWLDSDRNVQFKIYVRDSQDVRNEMRDPEFTNPWEYVDWLRTWTREHATAAPFWSRYWHDGGYGDIKFDIFWTTAPNSERALLSMLDRATRETVKWVLRSAVNQFESLKKDRNAITDEDTIGRYSYRVTVYEDINYNSTGDKSPEYLKSLSFTCTPDRVKPCMALVVSDLSWIGGMVSSVSVRNATVTLYSGRNQTGTRVELAQDTTWLSDYNDRAWSLMITPRFNWPPGKIVVNNDEWPLSDQGFPPSQATDAAQFARNVANWFTGGGSGKFLVYSTQFLLNTGLVGDKVANTMQAAGHEWTTKNTPTTFTLDGLLQYDGIFLAGTRTVGGYVPPDMEVLVNYVKAGGSIYLAGGADLRDPAGEAAQWNRLLNTCGIRFESPQNDVDGILQFNSSHRIFVGVHKLFQRDGNSISKLNPSDPSAAILVQSTKHEGLYAVCSIGAPIDGAPAVIGTIGPGTAVTLISFTATDAPDHVTLAWQTASEIENEGFNIWRSQAADGAYTKLNPSLIPARGSAEAGASYTYADTAVAKGVTYYYKLEDIDLHGVSTFHGPVSAAASSIHRIYLPVLLK